MTLKRKELERHQTESEENKHETHEYTHTKVKNEKGKKWHIYRQMVFDYDKVLQAADVAINYEKGIPANINMTLWH